MNHFYSSVSALALIVCCSMSGHHLSMSQAFAVTQHHSFKNGAQQQQQPPINQFDSLDYQHRLQHNLIAKSTCDTRRKTTRMSLVPSGLGYIASSYNNALTVFPTITKAATGFFLCGAGDVLAQCRSIRESTNEGDEVVEKKKKFDWKRLLRFAGKGTLGTLIWAAWYDLSDVIVENIIRGAAMNVIQLQVYKTALLLLLEQFLACPTIFGLWEIPVSTLLNVGPFKLSLKQVGYEIKSKLGDMLIENAKVWTVVNIFIYNVPVQFRAPVGNIMDIVWQSIVSDFAADCGTADTDEDDIVVQNKISSQNTGILPIPSSSQQ